MKNPKIRFVLTFLLLNAFWFNLDAQNRKAHKIWIYTGNSNSHYMGGLYAVDKEHVIVINTWNIKEIKAGNFRLDTFNIRDIRLIKIRKNGKIAVSALIGAVAGVAVASVAHDTANYYHPNDSKTHIGYGIYGGLIYGTLIGLIKKKYRINRSEANYLRHYKKLRKSAFIR